MATIADLMVSLSVDAANFNNGVAAVKEQATGLQGVIQNGLGVALGIGLTKAADLAGGAMKALGGVISDAFKDAADSEVINVKLAQAIKNTAGAIVPNIDAASELADKYKNLAGGSDEAVKSAETILLRFKEINKSTFPQALQVSADLAVALGTDMPSAAATLGRALENPQTGLRSLREAGVNFSAAQTKMIETMMSAGQSADAQRLIMDALSASTGGMASAAADTMSGRMTIMRNNLEDAAKSIAEKLLPTIERLFDQYIKPNIPTIVKLADTLGDQLAGTIGQVFDWLNKLTPAERETIGQIVAVTAAVSALSPALGGLSTMISGVTGLMTAGLAPALVAALPALGAIAVATGVYAVANAAGAKSVHGFVNMMGDSLSTSVQLWRDHNVAVTATNTNMWDGVRGVVDTARHSIESTVTDAMSDVLTRVRSIRDPMTDAGRDAMEGFRNGFNNQAMYVQDMVQRFSASIPEYFRNALQIHSPSRVMEDIGKMTGQGFGQGITASTPQVEAAATKMVTTTVNHYHYNANYSRPPASEPIPNFNMMRAMVSR